MIINANALHIPLADQSVHMIVTSPPYWGLRDYGTATWIGGEAECNHKPPASRKGDYPDSDRKQQTNSGSFGYREWNVCGKCGAIRIDNQLGLERAPEEYIANMVAVFRECWRVLRDDGTLWMNIGDSYAGGNTIGRTDADRNFTGGGGNHLGSGNPGYQGKIDKISSLKPKDLIGIPWRLAFALQADGWYLRSDIIWSKPNPMPESVTDRPTKSHEYLFLLAKQARYYYDAEAIREEQVPNDRGRTDRGREKYNGQDAGDKTNTWIGSVPYIDNPAGRNRRTVWTIPIAPYKGAHFATFPPALVEPCIKAGTSERGVCPKCGKGWRRVVEHKNMIIDRSDRVHELGRTRSSGTMLEPAESNTLGWQPSCTCDAGEHEYNEGLMCIKCQRAKWVIDADNLSCQLEPIPCLVFDPFIGSGTTVKVAYDLGRRGVGLDLSLDYLDEQARKRIHNGHTARLF